MEMNLSKAELLIKCEQLGISKCKSKNKTELIELINKKSKFVIVDEDDDENDIINDDDNISLDENSNTYKINALINKIIRKMPSEIQTKIRNINKASYDRTIPAPTKRVSQNSRIYIPYALLSKNNLDLNKLNTHEKGVCVGIPYNIYEEIRDNTNRNELDEYLIQNIGGDNIVSSIVVIMKTEGYSGSSEQRKQLTKLLEEAKIKNWIALKRKENIKNVNSGNDKWEGHYYYNICGGEQECFKSWEGKEPQIFTPYKNFMSSDKIIADNKACLVYLLLHAEDISTILKTDELNEYLQQIKSYLQQTLYNNISCYDLIMKLKTIDKNNHLVSPIICEKISIEDFRSVNKINISHNEAVCKNKIYFCENNNKMISDYRPGNLFWDLHFANMRQQDETIEEYWASVKKSIDLYNSIY